MSDGSEDLGPRLLAASTTLGRGDVETARRAYELILLDAPRFAPAWDGLGSCFEAEGDLRRAGECFRKAMRLDRQNWLSPFHWGAALHRAGELRDARRWLRAALRIAPGERRIYRQLGQCCFDMEAYEEALACYRRALELPERDVLDAELHVDIGAAAAECGDFTAAEKAYERACLLSPNDPVICYHWALLSARIGDAEGAERLARRARALDPRSLRYVLLLIELALDGGRWELARQRIADLGALPGMERLARALEAEQARREGNADAARRIALSALVMDGPPSDQAVDSALATLRKLRGASTRCRGFRLVVEADCAENAYFRPYVVLAESEEQARWFVAELQDALDSTPWRIVESESFEHEGEELAGVYHLLLARVLFPRDISPPVDSEAC